MSAADIIVIIWTILVAVFLGFSIAILLLARSDRLAVERDGGSDVIQKAESIFIVEARERRSVIHVLGWSFFLIVGVAALLPLDRSSTSLIIVAGLFVGLIALGVEDVIELTDRLRFRGISAGR